MRTRAELNALAAEDVLFKERLERSDALVAALNSLRKLHYLLKTCSTDEERANVQRVIDEGTEECRLLAERVLQIELATLGQGKA